MPKAKPKVKEVATLDLSISVFCNGPDYDAEFEPGNVSWIEAQPFRSNGPAPRKDKLVLISRETKVVDVAPWSHLMPVFRVSDYEPHIGDADNWDDAFDRDTAEEAVLAYCEQRDWEGSYPGHSDFTTFYVLHPDGTFTEHEVRVEFWPHFSSTDGKSFTPRR